MHTTLSLPNAFFREMVGAPATSSTTSATTASFFQGGESFVDFRKFGDQLLLVREVLDAWAATISAAISSSVAMFFLLVLN
jgi:hypothetical protein